jgi:hypothetical protein
MRLVVLCSFLVILCGNSTAAQLLDNTSKLTVLAGSVTSYDKDGHTIELSVRSGSSTEPTNWEGGSALNIRDLQLRSQDEPRNVKLRFSDRADMWKLSDSKLAAISSSSIRSGAPVIIVIRKAGPLSLGGSDGEITKLVLLQACIEESCSKAKCKGGPDCREKSCDCPKK